MISALLFLLAMPVPADVGGVSDAGGEPPIRLAQVTIEQRVIIRVPLSRPARRAQEAAAIPTAKEKKGPRCLEMKEIRAASLMGTDSLVLITEDGDRYRARMERGCRASDFYSGFYMEPGRDGELCANRDSLQARSGMECRVESFSKILLQK